MINHSNIYRKSIFGKKFVIKFAATAIIACIYLNASLSSSHNLKINEKNNRLYTNNSTTLPINALSLGKSRQAILVESSTKSSVKVSVRTYEKDSNNKWILKLSTNGVVGKKGMSTNRHEGDMTTPEGIFGFVLTFGRANNPGTKMQYRKTHPGDYWLSTPNKYYNTWATYNGNPEKKYGHGKYENLYATSLYKYAAALDFNYGKNKVIGKGSAIFLHIAPYSGGGTAGCIGIPESKLVQVLRWMNPGKNPKIIIGTEQYLKSISK